MATTQPTPSPDDAAHDLTWQPPPVDPHPADPQRPASGPYTATDGGTGITADSLQAWQDHRGEFGTFVRADVADVAGSAGPPYIGRPGAALVAPSLVLTDDRGRQLALNGTPCGFDGEGPRGTARILVQEGLLTELAALPAIPSRHQLTVQRTATAPHRGCCQTRQRSAPRSDTSGRRSNAGARRAAPSTHDCPPTRTTPRWLPPWTASTPPAATSKPPSPSPRKPAGYWTPIPAGRFTHGSPRPATPRARQHRHQHPAGQRRRPRPTARIQEAPHPPAPDPSCSRPSPRSQRLQQPVHTPAAAPARAGTGLRAVRRRPHGRWRAAESRSGRWCAAARRCTGPTGRDG